MLGRTCITMQSASLQLYFKTWEGQLSVIWMEGERKPAFENGFLQGYRICFGEVLNLAWDDCPADFEILEQITLARNRDQHPENIDTMRVSHTLKDRQKFRHLFFVSEFERKLYSDHDMEGISWMSPAVHVSRETLFAAIEEVETLAEWLEERMLERKYRSANDLRSD
jgi:hypothetical protein